MTTLNQAREIVLAAVVAAGSLPTKVQFENEDWPPNGSPGKDDSWLRVWLRMATSGQNTLGPVGLRKWERKGILVLQVFTKLGSGVKTGDDLARTAALVFEGTQQSGVDFFAANTRAAGKSESWHLHNVDIPFTFYETR